MLSNRMRRQAENASHEPFLVVLKLAAPFNLEFI
jgi:hypothetical protein